jgi:hypothetical protein
MFSFSCFIHHSKSYFQDDQDSFPVVPPGCSDNQSSIQEFIAEAKAALVSVGIIRDAVVCKFTQKQLDTFFLPYLSVCDCVGLI